MNTQRVNELIDRLASDQIQPDEWNDLEMHAIGRPALWREIAVAQYERDRFDRALNATTSAADLIELPLLDELPDRYEHPSDGTYRIRQWNQWAGWALAAVLVLAFAMRFSTPDDSMRPTGSEAHIGKLLPGEALNNYLQVGRESGVVMGEMPRKVLIQTRQLNDGQGYEVYFLRQILERTEVPDLYQYGGENELGQPTLVRYEQPVRRGM